MSSSQSQIPIHPSLLPDAAVTVNSFLNGLLDQSPNDPPGMTTPASSPPAHNNIGDNAAQVATLSQFRPPPPSAMLLDLSLASHGNLIKQLKLVKSFSQESVLDLENFAVAPTLEECFTFMFAATLETRDLLKELVKNKATESFEIKEPLKKIVTLHAKAFVFSSTTTSYVGPDIPEKVLLAMHANKTSDLPSKQDIIGKEKVIKEINSALSDAHHWMKARLLDTLKKTGSTTGNIGAVTGKILGGSGILATLQLHMRVAVVRWHLVHFPSLLPKKFWPHVDDFLAQALEKGHSNYTMVLNKMYKLDIAEYSTHDMAKFPVLDLLNASDRVDKWTATANIYFDKIRPQKLTDEERIAPVFDDGQGGVKQKRAEDDIGGRLEDGDESD
ncbi:hypothetical protein IW261DRAFT_1576020 [Armillaria novae-zelandiae]|uniref:Uncharacterized protein n=1 Tax=Armillaria novae-zelandiae TaxID=153914 RepID=A0AA39TTR4_9AGAR|nr:hypothetical protein IW261DRAFT_1576020 [Armillaria novae-zelandiae]